MSQPGLFDRPIARATDPATSHQAAASVTKVREKQQAVLNLLRIVGPSDDAAWIARYMATGLVRQSYSGLQTRRSELVKLGLVRDSGRRVRMESGRQAIVWECVPC